MKSIVRVLGIALLGSAWLAASPAAAAATVAGLAPYQRPADAPVIKEFARDDAWRANALRGVSQPPPTSILKFLDFQGAWYTPFTHPGMPGPYDLRGMHVPLRAKP